LCRRALAGALIWTLRHRRADRRLRCPSRPRTRKWPAGAGSSSPCRSRRSRGRSPRAAAPPADELAITYLGWAGVELRYGDNAVFVDPQLVFRDRPARQVQTAPIASTATSHYALVTHLHPDHFDPVALRQALSDDGTVFAEASMAASVAAKGLPVASLAMWEPFSAGGFDGHDFLVFRFPPPTASATRRCPGSCAPPAAASSTAARHDLARPLAAHRPRLRSVRRRVSCRSTASRRPTSCPRRRCRTR